MKAEFWKQGLVSVIAGLMSISFALGILIAGIILTVQDADWWSLIAFGGILLLVSIPGILYELQKVILTEEGIELKFGKKQLKYICWTNVTNVKVTPIGRGTSALTFLEDNKRIDIVLMPKTFNAFMDICPDIGIKYQVKEFPAVQSLMKRYLKKKDDSHKNK